MAGKEREGKGREGEARGYSNAGNGQRIQGTGIQTGRGTGWVLEKWGTEPRHTGDTDTEQRWVESERATDLGAIWVSVGFEVKRVKEGEGAKEGEVTG